MADLETVQLPSGRLVRGPVVRRHDDGTVTVATTGAREVRALPQSCLDVLRIEAAQAAEAAQPQGELPR